MPEDAHRQLSRAVLERLVAAFPMLLAQRVGLYWPQRREISLFQLAKRILSEGGVVALPAVVTRRRPIQFRTWIPGDPLSMGLYGIPFPRDGVIVQPDALIVPVLGFDPDCHRLGYGDGGYDRTLASARPQPLAIGVAFDFMRLASIDPLPHDVALDFIVTETTIVSRSATDA